jgi:hypothetical protein
VAKVSSRSGVVQALSSWSAKVNCKITTPDNEVINLSANVTVGLDDDNSPTLSDNDLSLDVNDSYDLDVENYLKTSKIKWV